MSRRITRRRALAASVAGLGYLYTAPATAQPAGANARLKVAGIGVGGKGSSDIDHAGNVMEVVGLCDVDAGNLGAKAKKWPMAKTFSDFQLRLNMSDRGWLETTYYQLGSDYRGNLTYLLSYMSQVGHPPARAALRG